MQIRFATEKRGNGMLHTEMTRKGFLATVAAGAAMMFGAGCSDRKDEEVQGSGEKKDVAKYPFALLLGDAYGVKSGDDAYLCFDATLTNLSGEVTTPLEILEKGGIEHAFKQDDEELEFVKDIAKMIGDNERQSAMGDKEIELSQEADIIVGFKLKSTKGEVEYTVTDDAGGMAASGVVSVDDLNFEG